MLESFSSLLRQNARIINVSSDWGLVSYIENKKYKDKFRDDNLTFGEINDLINDYTK